MAEPTADGRTALSTDEAAALREAAAHEREQADTLAAVLEDIVTNGLPDPAQCTPRADAREAQGQCLLGTDDARRHVA
ncbi:MAG: hypothetical protein HOV68_02890 [Streptomycetaceae bacterium]|nr:hypothetical protein [Streptomycetaceae bacterium]